MAKLPKTVRKQFSAKNSVIEGYIAAAGTLTLKYETVSSAQLYAPVKHMLRLKNARVLDIGAGTGRDAAWLASQCQHVLAVEPVVQFRKAGQSFHTAENVEWLDDTLPDLGQTLERGEEFDIIILSAVWHHLTKGERQAAMNNLKQLTASNGRLIISLRNGPSAAARPSFPTNGAETKQMACDAGFQLLHWADAQSVQNENQKANISWAWLVFAKQGPKKGSALTTS